MKIFVQQEDANTVHLSIPPAPSNLSELSDADLEKVAGGKPETITKRRRTIMEPQALTRRELETALIQKCWKDSEFRKAVVSDAKKMLERQTGQKLPRQLKIFIHEEDANTLHLTIPPVPGNVTELSDADLEKVAGGTDVVVTMGAITALAAASLVLTAVAGTKQQGGW